MVEGKVPSLIDDIFSNNITDIVLSGNICMQLSEHFLNLPLLKETKLTSIKFACMAETGLNITTGFSLQGGTGGIPPL